MENKKIKHKELSSLKTMVIRDDMSNGYIKSIDDRLNRLDEKYDKKIDNIEEQINNHIIKYTIDINVVNNKLDTIEDKLDSETNKKKSILKWALNTILPVFITAFFVYILK